MLHCLQKFRLDRRASIGVVFSLTIVPVIGLTGLAAEFAHLHQKRSELQQILDSSVLNAIREPETGRIAQASSVFTALASKSGVTGATASFEHGVEIAVGKPLKGRASTLVPGRFGWSASTVSVFSEAIAAKTPVATSSACYMVLDPNGNQSFLVNSGAKIVAPNYQIDVKSNANPAVILNAGTSLGVKKLCIAGQGLFNGTPPAYQTGCATSADPLAGKLPVPATGTCTHSNKTFDPGAGTREVEPGVWCGWNNFNGAQTIKFKPGLYVIRDGDITINAGSTVTGTDVTFYFVGNTNLRFNGNVTMNLAAPTTGNWAGILMAEAATASKGQFIFNGVRGTFSGQIYLPNREVVLNSASKVALTNFAMISHRLILNTSEWTVTSGIAGAASTASTPVRLSR